MSSRGPILKETLELSAYFRSRDGAWRWVQEGIDRLPEPVRPTHFGETERARRKPTNALQDRQRFAVFAEKHRGGFFLYGHGFQVEVNLSEDRIPSRITFLPWGDARNVIEHSASLLLSLEEYGAFYGFAAATDEYGARNQYAVHFLDGGTATGYCGRSLDRYVPGLYWLNYFSDAYLDLMPFDVAGVAAQLGATASRTPAGTLLRLYDGPADWVARQDEVGQVIHATKNVFSIRRVEIPQNLYRKDSLSLSVDRQWP